MRSANVFTVSAIRGPGRNRKPETSTATTKRKRPAPMLAKSPTAVPLICRRDGSSCLIRASRLFEASIQFA
ncbi:hypothetical protein D9M72_613730 [compost metagenome]